MGDQQEVEDQNFKRILAENKILPEKKTFVIVSLAVIIVLFILTMINIRDTNNVFYFVKELSLSSSERAKKYETALPASTSTCPGAARAEKSTPARRSTSTSAARTPTPTCTWSSGFPFQTSS